MLLKNGNVIDPASGRTGRLDIAIAGERVVRIAADLATHRARTVVDVSAYYVTPGLIDLHAYVNAQGVFRQGDPRTDWRNVNPEHNTLRHGVTTVVDGGSTGWKNFDSFKQLVIDRSEVRVLAFLNIVGSGMLEGQGTADLADLDVSKAIETARRHSEIIVGIRSPHLRGAGPDSLQQTVRAAESIGRIAAVEYLDDEAGDAPALVEARKRGVLFDLGGSRFSFRRMIPAVQKGVLPDVISTGMDKTSLLLPRADMMTTLSKFLNMGVPIEQLLERVTLRAARAIKRPELGTLREGGLADIAVIEMQTGRFGFLDAGHNRLRGERRLRAVLTIRKGEVLWDSEGLSRSDWSKAGPYTNYR